MVRPALVLNMRWESFFLNKCRQRVQRASRCIRKTRRRPNESMCETSFVRLRRVESRKKTWFLTSRRSPSHLDRYIRTGADTMGNGVGNETGNDGWAGEGQESRAPAEGARLISAASVEPYSGAGGSSRQAAVAPSSSAWEEPWQKQAGGERSGHEEEEQEEGPRGVWSRLGQRVAPAAINNGHSSDGGGPGFDAQPHRAPPQQQIDQRGDDTQQWADWAQTMGGVPGSPSDAAVKLAAALRVAAGAATAAAAANGSVGAVSASGAAELAYMTSLATPRHAEGATAASSGGGSAGWMSRGGRVGRGGRSNTWVRGGLKGRGAEAGGRAGVARGGGRAFRGGRRGRGIVAKSLGRGGGWHSTGSVATGGRGGAGVPSSAATAAVAAVAGGQRETWNKVWVRKDLRAASDAMPPGQQQPDEA